jgi:hypothetical protein
MAHRNPQIPANVANPTAWPYDTLPKTAKTSGSWKMGMSAGGSMVAWPADQNFPESLSLIEAFRGERDQLEKFFVTFCMRGYETDPLHTYQAGNVWLFNWISGTLSQVHIAGQVAKLLFEGKYDDAWTLGRAFERDLQEAEEAGFVSVQDGQSRPSGQSAV